ncbi:MAG: ADP-ribosylation factor-like protein [Promethearchaeota archaeon]
MGMNKVSFLGAPAVGKTTLLKLLSGQQIPNQYIPTQGFDRKFVEFNGNSIFTWDFGGQRGFLPFYRDYFMGSDLIIVVTDSTPINVLKTKQLVEWARKIHEDESDCNIIAIANKQDLNGHMSADRVANVLGIPAYPMIATNTRNREELLKIIKRHVVNE